jgi:diguanylate cyclase (GGDEF)-like protein
LKFCPHIPQGQTEGAGLQGVSILAFLNPIILSAFCAAFLLVYSKNLDRKSALWFALSYGACASGFLVEFLRGVIPPIAVALGTNTLFMLTLLTTVKGLAARFGQRVPLVPIALFIMFGYAWLLWFFLADPNIGYRVIGINLALGGVGLSGLWMIWRLKLTGIDRILRGVFGVVCLQFFLRPFLVFWLSSDPISQAGYLTSRYAVTLQFTVAVTSMAFAAALLLAVIQDHLRDLKQESSFDPLSGVLNRRGFDGAAEMALANGGRASSIVIADIDHFKRINDTYGHSCGDAVIAAVGTLLQTLFGENASVGRIGGEEFAMIFPNASEGDAARHADKARRTLASLTLPGMLSKERITASFGVCAAERGMALFEVMEKADAALYEAKRAGRNRVAVHGAARRDARALAAQAA